MSGTTFEDGTQFRGAGTNLLAGGGIDSENLELGGAAILGTNTLTGVVRWTAG